MNIETMEDLFREELKELYDEEQRLVKALPKMARNSSSERLRQAFRDHLEQTRGHVRRLEECFREVERRADSVTSEGMEGLIEEGERVIESIGQSPLRDAALIGAARRVEHYEIAAYSSALSIAHMLGYRRAVTLLEQTLQEERDTEARLAEIAEHTVNQEALQLGAHQRG